MGTSGGIMGRTGAAQATRGSEDEAKPLPIDPKATHGRIAYRGTNQLQARRN